LFTEIDFFIFFSLQKMQAGRKRELPTGPNSNQGHGPQADSDDTTSAPVFRGLPPRSPTSQERADELLMRWRLARAAGIPADRRLDQEDAR
jgi:hypothetical protein